MWSRAGSGPAMIFPQELGEIAKISRSPAAGAGATSGHMRGGAPPAKGQAARPLHAVAIWRGPRGALTRSLRHVARNGVERVRDGAAELGHRSDRGNRDQSSDQTIFDRGSSLVVLHEL